MKNLIDPETETAPAAWREKMAREWKRLLKIAPDGVGVVLIVAEAKGVNMKSNSCHCVTSELLELVLDINDAAIEQEKRDEARRN